MSDIKCPFDGDFCQKKQERFDEWKQFVFSNPHLVHKTTGNMFADCPIKHSEERKEICERYRRYCFIVQKVLEGVQQSLAKNANEQR